MARRHLGLHRCLGVGAPPVHGRVIGLSKTDGQPWDFLPIVGAIPVSERIVIDRNRITGAGVTAGIDFGLVVAAQLFGADVARAIQLMMEYDPAPPFDSGSPRTASAALVSRITERCEKLQEERRRLLASAVALT